MTGQKLGGTLLAYKAEISPFSVTTQKNFKGGRVKGEIRDLENFED